MIAEILTTGDEVMLGDLTDTNSGYLCDQLKLLGIRVSQITARGDHLEELADTLDRISRRADLCLCTGGLGPTADDLTAAACARAACQPLQRHPEAWATMVAYFDKRGFVLTKDNEKQADLPAQAAVLPNAHGTAPGFCLMLNRCLFFFMPGVPSEMKQMMAHQVIPRIRERIGPPRPLSIDRLTVFGLTESRVGAQLSDFGAQFPGIRLGFRASFPVIEVKLVQDRPDPEVLTAARDWAVSRLENKVISTEGLCLAAAAGQLLRQHGQTLAVAESCTGGLIASMITDVAGSSDYFLLSAVTYANAAKVAVLGVLPQTLEAHGAVHETTAREMAVGVRNLAGSDWAIATTGIAGPGGGSPEKPVGTVCIGLDGPRGSFARRFFFRFDDRDRNKKMFAAMALETLRRELIAAGD